MNHIRLALLSLFLCPGFLCAQDGYLFSAKPPLVIRFDRELGSPGMKFTNTSSSILHGVTVNVVVKGQKVTRVIIDTIAPDATYLVSVEEIAANNGELATLFWTPGAGITCTNYSKPIPVPAFGP